MSPGPSGYWYECPVCGFLASELKPSIASNERSDALDEALRCESLDAIRRSNFEIVLDILASLMPGRSLKVLDVGCAYGWFLEAAAARGHEVIGIEPDAKIAALAGSNGIKVHSGFFPDDLPPELRFDLIAFNDVFEHLPDPGAAAAICHQRLNSRGLLAVTLPTSKGTIFRASRLLEKLSFRGPMERLWQIGFPSPHLTYFHPDVLAKFLARYGFRERHRQELPAFTRKGLWKRIRFDRRTSAVVSVLQFSIMFSFGPILQLLPSDISFQVFERVEH